MYGSIVPMPYSEMRDQLEKFGVVECNEHSDGVAGPCRVFRQFRMGVGTDVYYNFPFDGNEAVVVEPEIIGILDRFGIGADEFMAAPDELRQP